MNKWWWKEYPDRDTEYVRWYPPNIIPMKDEKLWGNDFKYEPDQLGFYIHVPFCEDICPFCPYNKFRAYQPSITRYLQGVETEIKKYSQLFMPKEVPFIYFGGIASLYFCKM